jgi:hypothetical protein
MSTLYVNKITPATAGKDVEVQSGGLGVTGSLWVTHNSDTPLTGSWLRNLSTSGSAYIWQVLENDSNTRLAFGKASSTYSPGDYGSNADIFYNFNSIIATSGGLEIGNYGSNGGSNGGYGQIKDSIQLYHNSKYQGGIMLSNNNRVTIGRHFLGHSYDFTSTPVVNHALNVLGNAQITGSLYVTGAVGELDDHHALLVLASQGTAAGAARPFITFSGSSASDQTKSISTDTSVGSHTGHVLVNINGTEYWIPFYAKN